MKSDTNGDGILDTPAELHAVYHRVNSVVQRRIPREVMV